MRKVILVVAMLAGLLTLPSVAFASSVEPSATWGELLGRLNTNERSSVSPVQHDQDRAEAFAAALKRVREVAAEKRSLSAGGSPNPGEWQVGTYVSQAGGIDGSWRLSGIGPSIGSLPFLPRVASSVTMTVKAGRISGFSACNTYMGSVNVATDSVMEAPDVFGRTRMACPGSAGEFEQRYLSALRSVNRWERLVDGVTLWDSSSDAEALRFVPVAATSTPEGYIEDSRIDGDAGPELDVVAGTEIEVDIAAATMEDLPGSWELLEYAFIGDDGAREELQLVAPITMTVKDGRVNGNAGCNDYWGSLTPLVDGSLGTSKAGFASTRKLCSGPIMEMEGAFLGALSEMTGWERLSDGNLKLVNGSSSLLFGPA